MFAELAVVATDTFVREFEDDSTTAAEDFLKEV